MPEIGAGAPFGSLGSVSGGHHPGLPLQKDQPFDIVDEVRQPDLRARSRGTGADRLEGMSGTVVTAMVQVSPHVKAVLTGPPDLVEIKPRGADEAQRKAVTLTPVQWTWDVKAVGDGTAVLQLELLAFIPNTAKEASFQVSTFRRQIPIQILGIDQAKRYITELSPLWAFLTAVITGIGGLFAYIGWKPSVGRSR